MHVSLDFKACLIDALGPGHDVHRAYDMGWDTKENGVLQQAAKDAGYSHRLHGHELKYVRPPSLALGTTLNRGNCRA